MDNLIDWKLELTLQERLTRREAVASFVMGLGDLRRFGSGSRGRMASNGMGY